MMCTVTSLCAGQSRVRFLAGARIFFSHNIQMVCGAHPATYAMGTDVSFPNERGPGVKSTITSVKFQG